MAFQTGTNTAGIDYRTLLDDLVSFATSEHVSAVAVNAGGTGHAVGDIITIAGSHGSAAHAATVEVLTLSGSAIATVALRSNGAYSDRVATVAVNSGGTGYAVDDIIELQSGTSTSKAKFRVTAVSSGVVTGIALEGIGGAYTVDPTLTGAATLGVGPSGYAGNDDLTVNVTMTAQISATAAAQSATTGTGTGSTFDLTFTATGWSTLKDDDSYSVNSIDDEREVVMQGTTAADDPIIAIRTYTQTVMSSTRYGWVIAGMDTYNDSLALSAQANVGPAVAPATSGTVSLLMFNVQEQFWFAVNGRRIVVVREADGGSLDTYQSAYMGLLDAFGTQSESPYPMYLSGSSGNSQTLPDDGTSGAVTGLTEQYAATPGAVYRHPGTGTWTTVQNSNGATEQTLNVVYPLGEIRQADSASSNSDNIADDSGQSFHKAFGDNGNGTSGGGSPVLVLLPSISDNEHQLVPTVILSTPSTADNQTDATPRGEMAGVFWTSSRRELAASPTDLSSEDTLSIGNVRYHIFTNAGRAQPYSYFAVKEE